MYNEKNSEFSIRDIVLQLLFVVLFVFILLWLFPTKTDVNKLADKLTKNGSESSLDILFDKIFNDNMFAMKDAAKDYFTKERVPKKAGESITITLGQMLDKKLLLPFVDKDGRQCDLTKSYVEVTKINDVEYTTKINLDCNEVSDYILVPMGCYDFCDTVICEKTTTAPVISTPSPKKETVKPKPVPVPKPEPKPEPKPMPKPKPKPEPKPEPVPVPVEYLYEYSKTVPETYSDWSNWSGWSTTKTESTKLIEVNTKIVENSIKEKVATKKITKEIPYTATEKVHVDNIITKTCAKWGTVKASCGTVVKGSDWVYSHTIKSSTLPRDTATTKYIEVKNPAGDPIRCKSNCKLSYSSYKVYTKTIYVIKESSYVCVDYDITVTPLYIDKPVTKYKTEVTYEPIYGYVINKIPYYQFRTRNIINGYVDVKWGDFNEKQLLDNGYYYTGNRKEIN